MAVLSFLCRSATCGRDCFQNILSFRLVFNFQVKPKFLAYYSIRCCSTRNSASHDASLSSEEKDNGDEILYPGYIHTSLFQKVLLGVGSAAVALTNPHRGDMVAVMGETTGMMALPQIKQKMEADSEGQDILRERPRINSKTVNIEKLKKFPQDTLGHAYYRFLTENGVSPDSRLPVQFVDDRNLAYVMQRYREVHDLVHTILGMPTNMQGEVAVKWVEAIQTGLPMCVGAAVFGPIRFKKGQRQQYTSTYLPWAIRCGFKSKFLMNIYFERRWEQPLDELRTEFNIEAPPSIPKTLKKAQIIS
ncbi:ubiquinone biosynthesis protein COQ4 homolog, mitochondrial-like [Limulus polyphemus]|uniref:Ubiquinone biosynthesis protein COQ4 homolog, mitochondrial n=1 Tax=Limulus polyphemus TaxID=6850 RepID=A0ABM1TCJ3_LIMPO|nr:ubiquinone biosynthesis protein COQ4 homolog, mitochondrial-like [Limulus polyphemus]